MGFLCVFCVHDKPTVATGGQYLALSKAWRSCLFCLILGVSTLVNVTGLWSTLSNASCFVFTLQVSELWWINYDADDVVLMWVTYYCLAVIFWLLAVVWFSLSCMRLFSGRLLTAISASGFVLQCIIFCSLILCIHIGCCVNGSLVVRISWQAV